MKKKPKRGYWYEYNYWVCVLCMREDLYKERVYDKPKPKEYHKRHIYHETACSSHFL